MVDFEVFAMNRVREIAASVIDKFGPSDLGAVVFTMDNRRSVDFTSDRVQLLNTIKTQPWGFKGMGIDWLWYRYSVSAVKASIEALSSMPDRRRAIVYISGGVPVDLEKAATPSALGISTSGGAGFDPRGSSASQSGEMRDLSYMMSLAFQTAARSNVSVYSFDICGLRSMALDMRLPSATPTSPACQPGLEVDYLRTVANATGGRAIVDTNEYKPGLDEIFVENSSYYLIGYQPADTKADGKYRPIEVRVNRPNVDVRTRSGYVAEKPDVVAKRKDAAAKEPLIAALSGILPKGDVPMSLTAVPFAVPGKKEAAVAVMLGVRQPIRETGQRTVEHVDLQVGAYNTDGKSFGGTRLNADVTVRAGATGLAEYEVLARLNLRPGRYQLRAAASIGSLATSGSLYFDVDVPDYMNDPVSLSGLMLTATPNVPIAPPDAYRDLLPVIPTTRRTFEPTSHVSAFVRIYQGGKTPVVAVATRIRVRNEDDVLVIDRREEVPVTSFGAARAADLNISLPVERLRPGQYLLTVESALGNTTAKRDVRFAVK